MTPAPAPGSSSPRSTLPVVSDADDALVERCLSYLAGELDAPAAASLGRTLEAEPAARRLFAALCLQRRLLLDLHSSANSELGTRNSEPSGPLSPGERAGVRAGDPAHNAPPPRTPTLSPLRAKRLVFSLAATLLLAAAALAIYVFVFNPKPETRNPKPAASAPIASVTAALGGTLVANDTIANPGDEIRPGEITLDSGSADFNLDSGVAVRVTGPTQIMLHPDRSVTLTAGSASFDCPHSAQGFTVHLPDGSRIVDLGTAFAVDVDAIGNTRIRVTEGRVRLVGRADAAPVELTAGQLGTIDRFGRATDSAHFAGYRVAAVYDFDTAQANARGVPLDANDGWRRIGGTGDGSTTRVRNAGHPDAHFTGHFLDARADRSRDEIYVRNGHPVFPPNAESISVSFILHDAGVGVRMALIGIGSPTRGAIRFGGGSDGNWLIRLADNTVAYRAPGTGPARIDDTPRTYRVTLDITPDGPGSAAAHATLRVENLTDGGETDVARVALPTSEGFADPSKWTTLSLRVRDAAVDDITFAYTLAPEHDTTPADRHREATAPGSLPKESPSGERNAAPHGD